MVLLCVCAAGCTRPFYRQRADRQAYSAIGQYANGPGWQLDRYSIYTDPRSRLYDPTNPDRPPMPPDDPTSHELMQYVDGKRGYRKWYRNGLTPNVDYFTWRQYLPYDADGAVVLDLTAAVLVARLNSRSYQENLEQLYLSALDVTFERFRFDAQFFGTNSTVYTSIGPDRAGVGGNSFSTLDNSSDLSVHRLFTGGGQLVANFANSFVWQFSGPDSNFASSIVDFSLIQPLLRFGGRARIMERLTVSERTLLANVRQMLRYQQGFYLEITTGRDAGAGPSRRGGFFGGAGLEGFTGVGSSGFGRVGGFGGGGGGGGNITGGAGAALAGGYIGLLQDQQQIRNQEANVAELRDSLAQLEAVYEAGRIDRFQVDLARQALYNAQSRLVISQAGFATTLDNFKVELGLPPDVVVKVNDPLLNRFDLIDQAVVRIQMNVGGLLDESRSPRQALTTAQVSDLLARSQAASGTAIAHRGVVERDMAELDAQLPARIASLNRLASRPEITTGDVGKAAFDPEALKQRIVQLKQDFANLEGRLRATHAGLESFVVAPDEASVDAERRRLATLLTDLSGQLLELSLVQARARLDALVLIPIELESGAALEIARANRLDWMNSRAALVDSWRLIEFNANALLSGLNVTVDGDLTTLGDNPVKFRGTTGQLQMGLQFDAPLTRLAERNIYRQSLIDYQQARRQYMLYEDRVNQSLRATLRQLDLDQLNFELRRAAVLVAINQVDLTRLRLNEPPRPGATEQFNNTTARDLVTALGDLLTVQNDFLSVWVNYEVVRMGLDFDLGTFQLDQRGLWIDPGPVMGESGGPVEPLPPPIEALPGGPPQHELPSPKEGRRDDPAWLRADAGASTHTAAASNGAPDPQVVDASSQQGSPAAAADAPAVRAAVAPVSLTVDPSQTTPPLSTGSDTAASALSLKKAPVHSMRPPRRPLPRLRPVVMPAQAPQN